MTRDGDPRDRDAALHAMDDDELRAELVDVFGPVDRQRLAELTADHDSAQSVVEAALARCDEPSDWGVVERCWTALVILWERWQPDRPSFETLDRQIQRGRALVDARELSAACDLWLQVWRALMDVCDRQRIDAVHDLDRRLCGAPTVFNWMQDLELELWNAGLDDASYLRKRVDLCREILARFGDLDALTTSGLRSAIAESFAALGDSGFAAAEFEALITAEPADATVWCRWARSLERSDPNEALAVLERGLARPGLRDRTSLLEVAIDIGRSAGRGDLVERARRELAASRPVRTATRSQAKKVGRNDPCPCGSGKKYKQCCLGEA